MHAGPSSFEAEKQQQLTLLGELKKRRIHFPASKSSFPIIYGVKYTAH